VDYITFYVDKGAPQTAIYDPAGNYINSKPLIKGTAEEPSYSDTTNSIITNVELAIKYISGTGTTYYWQHYVSSGEWKATTSPLWIDADAQDGAYDTASEQWSWDSSEVDWQNQTKHWVYTRAYDGAGNVESPASEMWLIYDVDTGQSVVTKKGLLLILRALIMLILRFTMAQITLIHHHGILHREQQSG